MPRKTPTITLEEAKAGFEAWRQNRKGKAAIPEELWAAAVQVARAEGNRAGPCLSRQISMYLAKYVGGWSTIRIGRFYNGRHHTTVLYAIGKIERLRRTDESVDALVEVSTAALNPGMEGRFSPRFEPGWSDALIETVAAKVLDRISMRLSCKATRAGGSMLQQGTRITADGVKVDIVDCH